jgi:hypothetical protein
MNSQLPNVIVNCFESIPLSKTFLPKTIHILCLTFRDNSPCQRCDNRNYSEIAQNHAVLPFYFDSYLIFQLHYALTFHLSDFSGGPRFRT